MQDILNFGSYKTLAKTRYVNDKQITDHYAIIPTGQGLNTLSTVSSTAKGVYDLIVRRFLSIFYPAGSLPEGCYRDEDQRRKFLLKLQSTC